MNKRFLVSVAVMFVASMLMGFVVHGFLLHNDYTRLTPNLFRAPEEAERHFAWMLLAHVFLAIGWTWIYRQGRENAKPWLMQGVRFGLAVAVLTAIPTYLIYYAVQPMPSDLVAQQIVFDTLSCLILGVVVAAVNRDPAPARV
jgi:drug/metabolite transporter (DMT)-like permease